MMDTMYILMIFLQTGTLLDDLLAKGIFACGMMEKERSGYPLEFKGTETAWKPGG